MAEHWYAIRTRPGAQLPQREYAVEPTSPGRDGKPRGKGYRIVPSLNPNVSAIERALSDNGFVHYMPAEKRIVMDRKKARQMTTRRFAIMPYVFVHDVRDWRALEETPGVSAIVGVLGKPHPIDLLDILFLRSIEAESEAEVYREIERREAMAKRVTRTKAKRLFPAGARIEVLSGIANGRHATVVGLDRDGRVKAIAESLGALGTFSVPLSDVRLAAE